MAFMPAAHLAELDELARDYWWHAHRAQTVAALVARFSTSTVLSSYIDVGCGPGATTRIISDYLSAAGRLAKDAEVAGLDFDPSLAEPCAKHGVKFSVCDLNAGAVPPLARRYELFTALDVLEHLKTPERLLGALRPQLTDKALGVIAVPAFQWLFSDWDRAAGHERRYDEKSLRELLQKSRFEVVWQSYLYSFAMPPAMLRRKVLKTVDAEKKLEFPKVPGWLNAALSAAGSIERLWLKGLPLPFGTTALAVVRPV